MNNVWSNGLITNEEEDNILWSCLDIMSLPPGAHWPNKVHQLLENMQVLG